MRRLTLILFVLLIGAADCARSDLILAGAGGAAGLGGAAGHGGSGQGGQDGGGGGAPPAPCVLVSAGAPIELVSFAPGNADTPDLAVIEPGSAAKPAIVLHQVIDEDANFWHPELDLVDYTIGAAWPSGVAAGHTPKLAGPDAHAWGRIATEVGAPERVGVFWYHGDFASPDVIPGVKFRVFDAASWKAGEEVYVDEGGEGVYALAPGPSVGPSEEGYVGVGYAAVWRASVPDGNVTMRVAVLDVNGAVAAGPLSVIPPLPYPGRSVDVVWTGTSYVVATSYDATCPAGSDPQCFPNAVVISAFAPSGVLPASIQQRAVIPAALEGSAPFRPRLGRHGDNVFAGWSEGAPDGSGPRNVYLARLDATGSLAAEPTLVAEGRSLATPVALAVTSLGIVVAWTEPGADGIPPNAPGHARLVVQQLPLDGSAGGAPVEIPVTEAVGTLAIASLATPRAVLLSWAGARMTPDPSPKVTYLARLDCAPMQ